MFSRHIWATVLNNFAQGEVVSHMHCKFPDIKVHSSKFYSPEVWYTTVYGISAYNYVLS
jgi:hypothetical protein